MAQRVTVTLIDDLDGTSEAGETVYFGLDGASWEIDLTNEHAAELRDALSAYVAVARKATSGRRSAAAPARATSSKDNAKIREWARDNGFAVSERGRIPAEVIEAYRSSEPTAGLVVVPAGDQATGISLKKETPQASTVQPPTFTVDSGVSEPVKPAAKQAAKPRPVKGAAKPKAAATEPASGTSRRRSTSKAKEPAAKTA